jgi:hypothetical protein
MKTIILLTLVLISLNSIAQIPSYVSSNGLVGWWPFNGNANDESGNGNNGIVNGSILSSDRNGNANNAYSFNGIDNVITISSQTNVDQNSNYTVSLWFNSPTSEYNGSFLSFGTWFCKLGHDSPGLFYKDEIGNQANNWYVQQHFGVLPTINIWNHLVIKKVNTTIFLYLNQIQVGTITSYGFVNFSTSSLIQFGYYCCQEFFNGSLDDIGIWNRELSDQEILALYQGCQMVITTQPSNQSVNVSAGNTTFSVASSASNPTYQWQTNLGLGFQSLSNAGQYNGVNTANLSVSNLNMSNDNQTFRCIINENGCVDTSDIATLTIIDDASVFEDNATSILISPNPITNQFSIPGIEQVASVTLLDMNGKIVKTLNDKEKSHDVSNLKPGMYFLGVRDENRSYMIKVMKD